MAYILGEKLETSQGHKGPTVKEALHYAIQVADALTVAHAAPGSMHRNIKPGTPSTASSG